MKRTLRLLALCLALWFSLSPTLSARGETLLFASDLHLGDGTPATAELLSRLLAAGADADAVLLLGDVTDNGREEQRQMLLDALAKASGVTVLVLPGNHDLSNQSSADFARAFAAYGWEQAFAVEPATQSYGVALTEGLWVVMLNTCTETASGAEAGGSISEELLAWCRSLLEQARQQGVRVLFCGHHPILPHSVNEEARGDLTLGREAFAGLLAASGLPVYLAGHRHIAHWAQQNGLAEILAGKLGEWPLRAGRLDIGGEEIRYTVMELAQPEEELNLSALDTMHAKASSMAQGALKTTSMAGDQDMVRWFDRTYAAYISGQLYAIREQQLQDPAYTRWQSPEITSIFRPWTAFLLENMTEDYTTLTVPAPACP